jgi:hypothetical protein
VGPADIVGTTCEALAGWGVHMRWLSSRLAYDSPRGRRVRVGGGSKLEISPNLPASLPVTTSGSVTRPVSGLGGMVRRCWKDPAPSAVQTQEPKTKVSLRLKATVGLM